MKRCADAIEWGPLDCAHLESPRRHASGPVVMRGHTGVLLEAAREVRLVGETGAHRDASQCFIDASPARDWVYRANIRFGGASGALPTAPANLPANEPF